MDRIRREEFADGWKERDFILGRHAEQLVDASGSRARQMGRPDCRRLEAAGRRHRGRRTADPLDRAAT